MQSYSVTFINNSQNVGSACLYQQSQGGAFNLMSLAWLAHTAYPNTRTTFQWTLDYSFVWAQTGMLAPGINFQAAQQVPADANFANMVTFSEYNGPGFGPVQSGGQPGMLSIRTEPMQQQGISVGIGMSGAAAFAVQAQPYMMYTFGTTPTYWLAFGNYQQGQVLDARSISNAVQLNFGGSTSLTVTLNPDGTFTIQ